MVIPDPNAWSIRTYDFISPGYAFSFSDQDGNRIQAPSLPNLDAGEIEVIGYIRRCTELVGDYLRKEGLEIPAGTLFVCDPGSTGVSVRTNQRTHEFLEYLSGEQHSKIPHYAEFRLQIMEADAEQMRAMVSLAGQNADHAPLLSRLETLAAEGKAIHMSNLSLSTRSGQRNQASTGTEQQQLKAFTLSDRHLDALETASLVSGTSVEIYPIIGEDFSSMDIAYDLDHDYSPPTQRWKPFRISGDQRIASQVADRHRLSFRSGITLADNTARLLGVWPTEKLALGEAPQKLQAAFLRGRLIPVNSPPEPRLKNWLKTYAEKIEPTPQIPETKDVTHPEMEVRFICTSFNFTTATENETGTDSTPSDPFGGNDAQSKAKAKKWNTVVEALTSIGVEFPAGSAASYIQSPRGILVRNTPKNLDLIEQMTTDLDGCYVPKDLGITLQIVQADGTFLRKLEKDMPAYGDHTTTWKVLETAATKGDAKFLRTVWIDSRSGARSRSFSGDEHVHLQSVTPGTKETKMSENQPSADTSGAQKSPESPKAVATPTVDPNAPGTLSGKTVVDQVGTFFEVDPVLGEDGRTIDLTFDLKFDYAPPTLRNDPPPEAPDILRLAVASTDYHRIHLISEVTVIAGKPRLVGMWKPDAQAGDQNADVLQAAFIRVDVLRVADKYLPAGLKR